MSVDLRLVAVAGLAALSVGAAPATAAPIKTVAQASDTGQYVVAPSLDTKIRRPAKILVDVRSTPAVELEVDYSIFCQKRLNSDSRSGGFTTFGETRRLPVLLREPKSCDVYLSAFYGSVDSEQTVKVDLVLRAKQYPKG